MKDETRKEMIVISAGSWTPLDIAIDKAMSIHGEVFIRYHNKEIKVIDPSRIMKPFEYTPAPYMKEVLENIEKSDKVVSIYKHSTCGASESIFNNIDYLGSFRSDFAERNIRNIRNQFVPDYVKKSLRELCIEK